FEPALLAPRIAPAIRAQTPRDFLLTEILRLDTREAKNDKGFAKALAELGDISVNDCFANSHRAHASMDAITEYLPHAAGPLLVKEVETLGAALHNLARPTAAIIGGSKVSTKLSLIENLLDKIDVLFIGGAMANTFLMAEGIDVQKSLIEPDLIPAASQILAQAHGHNCQLLLPHDAIVAASPDCEGVAAPCLHIPSGMMILDIGPATVMRLDALIRDCRTVLWNGPVGMFEKPAFAGGTLAIAKLVAERTRSGQMQSIAGGGDTVAAIQQAGVLNDLTYVSTAGGAFLEFLEGKELPGIKALMR
ncbi:MAG: phosphoglycerate kinase, partial [Bdellovibrionales bacterium]